ncbi:hypothetical protein JB92DRAFT_2839078 [Gautieria morchelliformis]|nr:hypothetical protein JB92DRAFT_2839078 [Gautieria morchelliformis]
MVEWIVPSDFKNLQDVLRCEEWGGDVWMYSGDWTRGTGIPDAAVAMWLVYRMGRDRKKEKWKECTQVVRHQVVPWVNTPEARASSWVGAFVGSEVLGRCVWRRQTVPASLISQAHQDCVRIHSEPRKGSGPSRDDPQIGLGLRSADNFLAQFSQLINVSLKTGMRELGKDLQKELVLGGKAPGSTNDHHSAPLSSVRQVKQHW